MCDIPVCVCACGCVCVRAHPLFYSWLNWAKRVDQEQLVSAAWGWGILHGPLIGTLLLFLSSQTEWRRRWTNRLLAVLISILIRCHFTGWLNKREGCKRSLLVLAPARRFLISFLFLFFFICCSYEGVHQRGGFDVGRTNGGSQIDPQSRR